MAPELACRYEAQKAAWLTYAQSALDRAPVKKALPAYATPSDWDEGVSSGAWAAHRSMASTRCNSGGWL